MVGNRGRRRLAAVGAAVVTSLLGAAQAHAFIYFTSLTSTGTQIERANNDGSQIKTSFGSGQVVHALGVTANNFYYAEDASNGPVFEAAIDGSAVHSILGAGYPKAFAFDGSHMYVALASGSIGLGGLDGSGFTAGFIPATEPKGVAVDSQYVYWTNADMGAGGGIGRARLDRTAPPQQNFITPLGDPHGLVVAGGYIYWADYTQNTIGRAPVAGGAATTNFIPATHPYGLATDGTSLYWVNYGQPGSIGTAKLDGSGVTQTLIPNISGPQAVAADTLTTPGPGPGPGPTPQKCIVPSLKGKTLSKARSLLSKAHCRLGTVTRPKHVRKRARLVVKSQRPSAGAQLAAGAAVGVTLKVR